MYNINFENTIIFKVRRHWISYIFRALIDSIVILLLVLIWFQIYFSIDVMNIFNLPSWYFYIGASILLLFMFINGASRWLVNLVLVVIIVLLAVAAYKVWMGEYIIVMNIIKDYMLQVYIGLLIVVSLLYLLVFITQVVDWYYNVLILTDKELIDISQRSLTSRETKIIPLKNISGVISDHAGLLGSLMGYGSIVIESSATLGDIRFDYIPKHESYQQIIMKTIEKN